jgi:hypothetical protein
MPSLRPLLALPLLLAGCVSTDPAVFVEAQLTSPEVAIGGSALGVDVTGKFVLAIHLGPRASGDSQVSLGAFSILDAGQKASLTTIELQANATDFPFTLHPDSDAAVHFVFDLGKKTLPADAKTKLCDPAGVVLGGTIEDSLKGGSTPFFSPIVHPAGCP